MEKKFLIIANWKANTPKFEIQNFQFEMNRVEIAIAAAFPFIDKIPQGLTRAAQDVSMFESGAYTGEVSAEMLKSLGVKYCLVGHSERRKYFGETNETVQKKVAQLEKNNIIPLVCARSFADIVPAGFIMYEPEEAISANGEYHPATNVKEI
ncbi:triosephosphate isomerase, partial [Candidatus Gottesmanbacteria bacterium]|nr:triosephosphate isomerase [Candidatus Gottesmanbacteria bacterium]